jgi:carboxymethylenebutenolidase
VDEFVFSFTHDQEVDWIFPGIPPTHKKVQLPFVAIVNVRGDRLYHEHISWDQGGALKQIGLLPEYLPFPFELPDSRRPEEGKAFYYRLPVSGAEAAEKMRDRASVDSNKMFEYKTVEK